MNFEGGEEMQRSMLEFFSRLHPCMPRGFKIIRRKHTSIVARDSVKFPTYCSPLLNLANQYGRGTRPNVVGQLSEVIRDVRPATVDEWREKYYAQHPEAKQAAAIKIEHAIENLRKALDKIDHTMVEQWVDDLLITKTFTGFSHERVVLEALSQRMMGTYRPSTKEDESRGIDGWVEVGTVFVPVQIKPESYRKCPRLPGRFPCPVVYYSVHKSDGSLDIDAYEFQQEVRLTAAQ